MKLKKIIMIIVMLLLLMNTICFADVDTNLYEPSELTGKDYNKASDLARIIVGEIQVVGTVIAILGIIVMGVKYITGSVEQKAEYKKTMVPYIIGCVFLFAVGTIVSIIYSLVSQL